jgi:Phosphopantetheine attachment site
MTTLRPDNRKAPMSEQYLASLWCEEIGIDAIEPDDTFLQVGGNSLTLKIIVNKVREQHGVLIDPQLFFQPDTSSLSQIAAELDRLLDRNR